MEFIPRIEVNCTSGERYFITPHFTLDSTSKVIFMVFDEQGVLCQDIQFNNGTWHLWSGRINDWMQNFHPNDYTEVRNACHKSLEEYYTKKQTA